LGLSAWPARANLAGTKDTIRISASTARQIRGGRALFRWWLGCMISMVKTGPSPDEPIAIRAENCRLSSI
jgi:hypothetical protein